MSTPQDVTAEINRLYRDANKAMENLPWIDGATKEIKLPTMFDPLPVAGYKPQSDEAIALVNSLKQSEERLLRFLDGMKVAGNVDQRWLAVGRTHLEQAFMAINRSIFQPGRVTLPEDTEDKGDTP